MPVEMMFSLSEGRLSMAGVDVTAHSDDVVVITPVVDFYNSLALPQKDQQQTVTLTPFLEPNCNAATSSPSTGPLTGLIWCVHSMLTPA